MHHSGVVGDNACAGVDHPNGRFNRCCPISTQHRDASGSLDGTAELNIRRTPKEHDFVSAANERCRQFRIPRNRPSLRGMMRSWDKCDARPCDCGTRRGIDATFVFFWKPQLTAIVIRHQGQILNAGSIAFDDRCDGRWTTLEVDHCELLDAMFRREHHAASKSSANCNRTERMLQVYDQIVLAIPLAAQRLEHFELEFVESAL
jgi:hypothetical protein